MQKLLTDLYTEMPWDELDQVVYDIGNVLVRFDPDFMLDVLFPGEDELHARLMEKVFHSPYWVMLDHGTCTVDEAAEAMTGRDPEIREEIRHTLINWSDLTSPMAEGVRSMQAAREHGKKIYLLSNYNDTFFEMAEKRFDFLREPQIDGRVISAYVHLLKPQGAIYQKLTDTYALEPSRTVFIDDAAANAEGALCMGWKAIWYKGAGTLADFMLFDA